MNFDEWNFDRTRSHKSHQKLETADFFDDKNSREMKPAACGRYIMEYSSGEARPSGVYLGLCKESRWYLGLNFDIFCSWTRELRKDFPVKKSIENTKSIKEKPQISEGPKVYKGASRPINRVTLSICSDSEQGVQASVGGSQRRWSSAGERGREKE